MPAVAGRPINNIRRHAPGDNADSASTVFGFPPMERSVNDMQIGNDLQRWIALTDAYARQIEQKRIQQVSNPKQLSAMADSLQKVSTAFERWRRPSH